MGRTRGILLLGVVLALPACDRAGSPPEGDGQVVKATWYNVPDHSPAHDRAGRGELTAASNRFGLGARVRVTRIGTGKSVVVRITDKLGGHKKPGIDLSREAAEQLEMVSDGTARVRVEVLP